MVGTLLLAATVPASAPAGVAAVEDLVIARDAGRFTLRSARLALVSPVGGRTVAAVFTGSGHFSFAPRSRIEQERLMRIGRCSAPGRRPSGAASRRIGPATGRCRPGA